MDLSHFKKVSEDEHKAVLVHPKGHRLMVAKAPMSAGMKKQLSALPMYAEGGDVSDALPTDEGDSIAQAAMNSPVRPEYAQLLANEQAKSNPQMDAVYGDAAARANQDLSKLDQGASAHQQYLDQQAKIQALAQGNNPNTSMGSNALTGASLTPGPLTASSSNPRAMVDGNFGTPMPAQPQDPFASVPPLKDAIQEGRAGIFQEEAAKSQQGQQETQALDKGVAAQKDFDQQTQTLYQQMTDHGNQLMSDIQAQHIDPTRYLGNMGTGQKISTAIGLILGGIGSGLTGKENMASKFLNDQIDRDIHAQEAELGKKHTLLSAHMQMFNNTMSARLATRAAMNQAVSMELQKAAANAMAPEAKARALQQAGDYDMKARQLYLQGAMMQTAYQGIGSGDPSKTGAALNAMRFVNPEMAKSLESRYVPGVGMGQVPVPEAIRNKIVAHQDVDQALGQALDFAKMHSGTLNPQLRSQAATMMNELQSKIRTAEQQGVYKESEANFMRDTIGGSPTDLLAKYTTVPKLKQLRQSKMSEYNNMLRGYGFNRPQITEMAPVRNGQ